jgi:hypothetical protein
MPKMENLNQVLTLIQAVINSDRGMKELTDVWALSNWRSNPREVLQKLNVLEERHAKRFRGAFMVSADIFEDVF